MSSISDAQKLEILYNKSFGLATSLPSGQLSALPGTSANNKIIPALQIFSQEIPSTAPIDLVPDLSFNQIIDPLGTAYESRKYNSTAYPWIVKYQYVQLASEQYRRSYNGSISGNSGNLLSQTIPFNYDPAGSYGINVYAFSGSSTVAGNFTQDNSTMPWYYDKDAGFITFYGNASDRDTFLSKNPLMTFWRYEGEFGLGSSTVGATGSTFGDYMYWSGSEWVTGSLDIHLGSGAGSNNQGSYAVAVGYQAGQNTQGSGSIAVG